MIGIGFSIAAFRGDRRGVSAIEFALLAPVLIAFYFGMSEMAQAFMAQKRMGHVAATVGDLAAQDDTLTTVEVNNIFAAGQTIMHPYSTDDLTLRLSSVTVDSAGVAHIDWSRGSGMSPRATGSTVTLPSGLAAPGESLIFSEVAFEYYSPVEAFLPGITSFERSYYLRPRTVEKVLLA
ncbi:MAG: pilus assembly protein [Caulobacterales bacterium]|nr:pilus assembly protein [Caulobacterales bacterium]